jgi:UDP-N-acetylmuramyl tripeptide synthase
VIVLAGKGHEDYQEINGERHAFSDLVEADRLAAWEAPMLKPMKLSELTTERPRGRCRCSFDGVSIDSRAIKPGQLFVALTGPRFDGHDYLNDVAAKGAVAALVEREVAESPCRNCWSPIPAWPWASWAR